MPFKRHLFCQNPMYNCGVIGVKTDRTTFNTFAVIVPATAPHPRWRRKPCNALSSTACYVAATVFLLHCL